MAIDFLERSEVIEECYEFLLGYAAQGFPTDEGSAAGREVRTRQFPVDRQSECFHPSPRFADRFVSLGRGLANACKAHCCG